MDNYLLRELREDNAFLRSQVSLLETRNAILENRCNELKVLLGSNPETSHILLPASEGSAASGIPHIRFQDSPKVLSPDFIPYKVPSSFGFLDDEADLERFAARSPSSSTDTVTIRYPFPITDTKILQKICEGLYSYHEDLLEPFLFGSGQAEWCRVTRDKKAFALVCRTWRNIGLESLYSVIRLRHVPYLARLVQVLENGMGGNDLGYGRFIKHIDLSFYIPIEWDEVYVEDIGRLLTCCPNLVSFRNRPMLPEISLVGRPTPTAIMSTLSYIRGETLQIVELSEGEGPDMTDLIRMIQVCPMLESLYVGYYIFKGALSPGPTVLRAPLLQTLHLRMTARLTSSLAAAPASSLLLEASKWDLPLIRCLSIVLDLHVRFPVSDLDSFLNMHGYKLLEVRVRDIVGNRSTPLNISIFLNRCPNLARLAFTPHNTYPLSPTRPHLHLRHVSLFGKIGDRSHQQAHFGALTGIKFPAMKKIETDALVSPLHWRSAGARVSIETHAENTTISARNSIWTDGGEFDDPDGDSDDSDFEPSSSESSSTSSEDGDVEDDDDVDEEEEKSDAGSRASMIDPQFQVTVKHDDALSLFGDMIQTASIRRSVLLDS